MTKLTKSQMGRAFAWILIVSLAWLLSAANLKAGDGSDEDLCNRVFLKCLFDALIAGILTLGKGLPVYLSFCLIGYSFCILYVENQF